MFSPDLLNILVRVPILYYVIQRTHQVSGVYDQRLRLCVDPDKAFYMHT